MKKLNYFRLFAYLLIFLLAMLYELRKDYEKYHAKQEQMKQNTELVKSND